MVKPFDRYAGVKSVRAGYTGGIHPAPSYDLVSSGITGHREAVEIRFDDKIVSYRTLLDAYFSAIDPTDNQGQFSDRGTQYAPAIFYHTETQKQQAETTKAILESSGKYELPIVVEILPADAFFEAEPEHQNYYLEHPRDYHYYYERSGRGEYVRRHQ